MQSDNSASLTDVYATVKESDEYVSGDDDAGKYCMECGRKIPEIRQITVPDCYLCEGCEEILTYGGNYGRDF